ncbi:hypothetical protein [Nocardia vaccinii]|nr:hypothetical protein [Nocardia vaccinii]
MTMATRPILADDEADRVAGGVYPVDWAATPSGGHPDPQFLRMIISCV